MDHGASSVASTLGELERAAFGAVQFSQCDRRAGIMANLPSVNMAGSMLVSVPA